MAQEQVVVVNSSEESDDDEFFRMIGKLNLTARRQKMEKLNRRFEHKNASKSPMDHILQSKLVATPQQPVKSPQDCKNTPTKNYSEFGQHVRDTITIDKENDENFMTPRRNILKTPSSTSKDNFAGKGLAQYSTPTHHWMAVSTIPSQEIMDTHIKFINSLSETSSTLPSTRRFISHFERNRDELSACLYKIFNETVFSNQLPIMSITWNSRMTSTAGRCYNSYNKTTKTRTANIELSSKLIGHAGRARDTLIHEMCHAATWLINEVNESHGYFWKYWASRANKIFPTLPPITRCHNYSRH